MASAHDEHKERAGEKRARALGPRGSNTESGHQGRIETEDLVGDKQRLGIRRTRSRSEARPLGPSRAQQSRSGVLGRMPGSLLHA